MSQQEKLNITTREEMNNNKKRVKYKQKEPTNIKEFK
jgi:hypothetical protein